MTSPLKPAIYFLLLRSLSVVAIWMLAISYVRAEAQPLLWLVEDKASGGKVYLFGSLHYGAAKFYPLPDWVLNAYESSDSLAVELDIDSIPVTRIQEVLYKQGYYSDDKQLSTQAGKLLWEKLTKLCNKLAVDPQVYMQKKPWLVAMELVNLQLSRSDYQQSLGLDKYFLTLARDQKPILELENLDDQIRLFAQLNDADQLQFLQTTLDNFAKGEATLNALAEAWYQGDENALYEGIFGAFRIEKIGQKLYPLIFVERNTQMATTIVTYITSSKKVFLIVGVGHMLGEDGLVALLKKKGYRVTKIVPDNFDEMNLAVPKI